MGWHARRHPAHHDGPKQLRDQAPADRGRRATTSSPPTSTTSPRWRRGHDGPRHLRSSSAFVPTAAGAPRQFPFLPTVSRSSHTWATHPAPFRRPVAAAARLGARRGWAAPSAAPARGRRFEERRSCSAPARRRAERRRRSYRRRSSRASRCSGSRRAAARARPPPARRPWGSRSWGSRCARPGPTPRLPLQRRASRSRSRALPQQPPQQPRAAVDIAWRVRGGAKLALPCCPTWRRSARRRAGAGRPRRAACSPGGPFHAAQAAAANRSPRWG